MLHSVMNSLPVIKALVFAVFALGSSLSRAATEAPVRSIEIYRASLGQDLSDATVEARFGKDHNLNRAWVQVDIEKDITQAESGLLSNQIGKPVSGLSYRPQTRDVVYTHGGGEVICAHAEKMSEKCSFRYEKSRGLAVYLDIKP